MVGYVEKEATVQGLQGTMSGAVAGAGVGIAAGAATGAAMGSVVPGIGTAIGAVVGATVGIVSGAFTGKSKKKAKRYARLANQVQQQREANRDYEQFLQMVRQQRLARASTLSQAVAAGLSDASAVSGAVSGQQSQTAHGINYLAEDRRLQELYLSYMNRAGVAASVAKDQTALFNSLSNLAVSFGTTMISSARTTPQGSQGTTGGSGSGAIIDANAGGTFTANPWVLGG